MTVYVVAPDGTASRADGLDEVYRRVAEHGRQGRGRPRKGSLSPTLKDLGLTRKRSSIAQRLADIPKVDLDRLLATRDHRRGAGAQSIVRRWRIEQLEAEAPRLVAAGIVTQEQADRILADARSWKPKKRAHVGTFSQDTTGSGGVRDRAELERLFGRFLESATAEQVIVLTRILTAVLDGTRLDDIDDAGDAREP